MKISESKLQQVDYLQTDDKEVVKKIVTRRWAPPQPIQSPIFGPENKQDAANAYELLQDYCKQRRCEAELNPRTGLPFRLFGNLDDRLTTARRTPDGFKEAAIDYLEKNELMMTSLQDEIDLELLRIMDWGDGFVQVMFQQTNKSEVPILDGNISLTFVKGRLEIVNSTLFPVKSAVIGMENWPAFDLSKLEKSLKKLISVVKDDKVVEINLRESQFVREVGKLILPHVHPFAQEAKYCYVWRIEMRAENDQPWLALVDVETYEILAIVPTQSGIAATIFDDARSALENAIRNIQLDLGQSANGQPITDFNVAERVSIQSPRFDNNSEPPDIQLLLKSNVYFHMRNVQDLVQVALGSLNNLISTNAASLNNKNPIQNISVRIIGQSGEARYSWFSHNIILPKGRRIPSIDRKDKGINEVCLDREVLYHEFIHAINYHLNPKLFEALKQGIVVDPQTGNLVNISSHQWNHTRSLDEGLAFYFSCFYSGNNQRWAEFAYHNWMSERNGVPEPLRDLVIGPQTVTEVKQFPDPSGPVYGNGMLWARIFWALGHGVANQPGLPRINNFDRVNALLFRSLAALPAPINNQKEFGNQLVNMAQSNDKIAVTSVLNHFGILP